MSGANEPGPFIVITAVLDAEARPASITRSHGEAYERALQATYGGRLSAAQLAALR